MAVRLVQLPRPRSGGLSMGRQQHTHPRGVVVRHYWWPFGVRGTLGRVEKMLLYSPMSTAVPLPALPRSLATASNTFCEGGGGDFTFGGGCGDRSTVSSLSSLMAPLSALPRRPSRLLVPRPVPPRDGALSTRDEPRDDASPDRGRLREPAAVDRRDDGGRPLPLGGGRVDVRALPPPASPVRPRLCALRGGTTPVVGVAVGRSVGVLGRKSTGSVVAGGGGGAAVDGATSAACAASTDERVLPDARYSVHRSCSPTRVALPGGTTRVSPSLSSQAVRSSLSSSTSSTSSSSSDTEPSASTAASSVSRISRRMYSSCIDISSSLSARRCLTTLSIPTESAASRIVALPSKLYKAPCMYDRTWAFSSWMSMSLSSGTTPGHAVTQNARPADRRHRFISNATAYWCAIRLVTKPTCEYVGVAGQGPVCFQWNNT
eukprot:m.337470 g.337470  ORF g.337470 m.337470 type:complete len:432 (+) comp20552_c0_seq2:312-1607(+)